MLMRSQVRNRCRVSNASCKNTLSEAAHGGSFAVANCMCGSASVRAAAGAVAASTLHLCFAGIGCCWGRPSRLALLLLLLLLAC